MTEDARVAVRAARRGDANGMIKEAEKDKAITEDERKAAKRRSRHYG